MGMGAGEVIRLEGGTLTGKRGVDSRYLPLKLSYIIGIWLGRV